jgi:ribosomal protein S18 acetylase RimI-like enzyme
MIKELFKQDDIAPFFAILGNAEFELFDENDSEHRAWLQKKIDQLLFCQTRFFGIYTEDQLIAGIASVRIDQRPPGICNNWHSAEIMQIGISTPLKKMGYGTQLLQYIESQLDSVYCLYLHTYPADYDVIAFYGKNGFMPVGLVPDFYGPGLEGKLYLRKVLPSKETK